MTWSPGLDLHFHSLAAAQDSSRSHGDYFALLGPLSCSVGQNDPAGAYLFMGVGRTTTRSPIGLRSVADLALVVMKPPNFRQRALLRIEPGLPVVK